jgi:hypothetical protein
MEAIMSSSVARIVTTRGSQFGAAVVAADEVTPTVPAKKFRLPDNIIELLCREELKPRTPEAKKEWDYLVGARAALKEQTEAYIERTYAEWRADLEGQHEAAKVAVCEQGKVLEGLKKTIIEDTREFLSADNARRLAQSAAHAAEVDLQNLSRFASKAEISDAQKRVDVATEKMEKAERKAAEWGEHLNRVKLVDVPAENKKLEALIEKEMELAAALQGRDPVLERFGIVQR